MSRSGGASGLMAAYGTITHALREVRAEVLHLVELLQHITLEIVYTLQESYRTAQTRAALFLSEVAR